MKTSFLNKFVSTSIEKTKNMLFNGASAVMDKIWSVDGGLKSTEAQPSQPAVTPAPSQLLLKGQTLIGQNGRLTKANCAQGELARKKYSSEFLTFELFRQLRYICWYIQCIVAAVDTISSLFNQNATGMVHF